MLLFLVSLPLRKGGEEEGGGGGGDFIRRGHLLDILALGWVLIQGNTVHHIT